MNTPRLLPVLATLALGASCVGRAHAMDSWYFNPTGSGADGAIQMTQLNTSGYGFIENTVRWNPFVSFLPYLSFEEHGAYQVSGLGDQFELTMTYEINGRLGFDGSAVDSGLISLYIDDTPDFGSTTGMFGANDGIQLAQFEVVSGSISAFPTAATVSASLVAGSLLPGYFFDAQGTDLSTVNGLMTQVSVLSQVIDPAGTNVVGEIACGYAGYTGNGCNGRAYTPAFLNLAHATVQDVGVVTLSYNEGLPLVTAVPEPASVTMMLAGLLGMGAWRRLRS